MLYTFFTFSTTSVSELLGYVGSFVTDITPLMLPIIAIGLGLFIVVAIVGAFRR